ncbi:MAG TPA: hypothetical protein VFU31_12700 [Candidatus Binatia bacterium]|nr:hypothetical protein [Candidatus Binatia bacterium]
MLDSKLQKLKDHFGISTAADWHGVRPEWILSIDGCGPKTLEYLRLMLAQHDLTLKDDRTPEYWRTHKGSARVCEVLGNELIDDDDGSPAAKDRGVICPFTVLIDSAEQHPFQFAGLRTDAADGNRPLIVPTKFQSLGRFPDSLGDYSLDSTVGGVGRCHVERKSMADAHSTILGWARKGEDVGHRDRFEQELERLSEMEAGLVVVECSFVELIAKAPQYGVRTASQNATTLHRSILSWMRKYRVQWLFADDRRIAEKSVFRWLWNWHAEQVQLRKAAEKEAGKRRQKLLAPEDEFDLASV